MSLVSGARSVVRGVNVSPRATGRRLTQLIASMMMTPMVSSLFLTLHAMKANLLLVALLSLLWGCTASTGDVNSAARPARLSSSQQPAALQVEPELQQPPRPVIYFSGEFARTGRFAWTNGITLKDGIDVAGGFTKWADGRLHLIHGDGSKELYRLGPRRTLTNNPALQPDDLVISRGHADGF